MDHHYATQQDRSELAEEVRFFREHSTKLKQMFKETVTVLSDLQSFNESLSLDVILDVQAQRCVRLARGVGWGDGWGCDFIASFTCVHLNSY